MTYFDEIMQQPKFLRLLIDKYVKASKSVTENLKRLLVERKFSKIIFTGLGGSLVASYPASYFLRGKGINAFSMEANELLKYSFKIIDEYTLVVAVSQSGKSKEVVDLHNNFLHMNNFINVTNCISGDLYKYGKINFEIFAGVECYSTSKTYTNSITMLLYIAHILGGSANDFNNLMQLFCTCANIMEDILTDRQKIYKIINFLNDVDYIAFIGSGPSYATASIGELCIQEVTKIYSSSYTTGQFLHGPLELIDHKYRAIVLDFNTETRAEVDRIINSIIKYSGKLVLLTNRDIQYCHENLLKYKIEYNDPYTSPILEVIPIQLFANEYAMLKGFNPGEITRISK